MSTAAEGGKKRLVITMRAKPGTGGQLAAALSLRALDTQKEPGCEQFDVLQAPFNPDIVVLMERWADQAALDLHGKVRAASPPALRCEPQARERRT